MRIAQIVPSLEARHGGPSRSVRGLAEGLARREQSVELLTTGPLDERTAPVVPMLTVRAFPRQWPDELALSVFLDQYLSSQRYEILHHHGLWQRTLHYARCASRKSNAPLVISPRGMMSHWAWNHRRWKKQLAAWTVHPGAFSAARGWHATSEEEADDIRRLGFTQPICVAPNGVPSPSPAAETEAARHWFELLPTLGGRRVALFYSRFHSKKRVLELIDLWLSADRGDWILLLVGIPEQYSLRQLNTYILRNSGAGRIIVEDGAGHPPPYAIASLFLLPSHSENFGLVVAEALVRGLAVLTTDSTPWHGLDATGSGRCVPWDDFGTALDALLAESPAKLAASGARGSAWAQASFSWDKTAGILLEFYRQLIDKG